MPAAALAGAQRIAKRKVRNLDNGLQRVCAIERRGNVVGNTRIECERPPGDACPTPLGISLRYTGDHIRLAHLRINGHALRTKRHAQTARLRHIKVELREFVRLRQDLLGRAQHGNAARLEDSNAIGLSGLFHKVRNHHDGHAAFVQRMTGLHKTLASARIEHRGGLIQNENARLHGEHAGKRHALLLATRERMGLVALKAHQTHGLQRLAHALRDLGRFDP